MFLVDKYSTYNDIINSNKNILDKLLKSFDIHNEIYNNIENILKKPNKEIYNILSKINNGSWKYSNFQHLIVYGSPGCNKENIVNKLLEKIYSKKAIKLNNVEYIINGYSNTKTKVMIKQSKYHIVIEPNNNGFDKYLIQEIIQNYAKTEVLSILKYKKLFKVVVIDKIDNLSYYAQASLRRTMEKYANTCKFIFISNQLSKIIEPLKSRCLLVRIPLPNKKEIIQKIINISYNEKIELSKKDLNNILQFSENKINHALILLDFKKNNLELKIKVWDNIIDKIVFLINDNVNTKIKLKNIIVKLREHFYILFITNINFQLIIRKIMIKLIDSNLSLKVKFNIINLTSIYENRISQGTRYIIHIESYILKIIYLLNNKNNKNILNYFNKMNIHEL